MAMIFDAIDPCPGKPVSPYPRVVTAYQQFVTKASSNGALSVNETGLQSAVNEAKAQNAMLSLDIETWPVNWPILQSAITAARKLAPTMRISFFGSGPVSGTMLSQGLGGTPSAFATAESINRSDSCRRTNAMADFTSPPCYLSSTQKMQDFLASSGLILAQARDFGKPVYAEICPAYSDNNQLIDPADWSTIIWNLCAICDGLIVWGHFSAWPSDQSWWNALGGLT